MSVHATDIDVRTRMLGIKRRIDVVAILQELAEAGIEIHTQVVLCPGWNDGPILEKTFRDLLDLGGPAEDDDSPFAAVCERGFGYEGAEEIPSSRTRAVHVAASRSLAIVPVGLSAHREGLTKLDPVTPGTGRRGHRPGRRLAGRGPGAAGLLLRLPQRRILPAGRTGPSRPRRTTTASGRSTTPSA